VPAGAALSLVVVLGLARISTRNPAWRDNATLFAQTIRDAPLSYWAWRNWGGELVLEGREAEAAEAYRHSIQIFPHDPNVYDDYASLTRREGRCGEAVPLFRRSLELDPERHQTAARLIGCLAAIGDYAGARREAESRLRAGRREFGSLVTLIDSLARQEHR
jgi:tetratricopeptide (TPR) repeat protein